MIAATRDTSTRSTPTPIAVMARRSKAEARREPCGGGQVTAEHQAEPYERHGERGPQRDQWPERRTPMVDRVDLIDPAELLFGDLRLEREPCRLEPASGSAERLLPVGVRRLVEHTRVAHARGDRIEDVEGGHERFAARSEAGGDRSFLGAREQQAAARPPWHPYPACRPLDRAIERGRDALPRPAHRAFPRCEHPVAILARGGGPRFPTQLHHARRELLADVVERHPGLLQAAGHEEAAERRRELRDAQRHRDLHRRAHRASRAARPVRASYWDTK